MSLEYLIFNLIIISGPLFFGSFRRFYFWDRLPKAIISLSITAIPFLIWDSLVTGSHWFFNEQYTLDIRIFSLPLEEILFFVTVPLACLFTWEMLIRFSGNRDLLYLRKFTYALYLLVIPGIILFLRGQEYTGLVLVVLAISVLVDQVLDTKLFLQSRFYLYLAIIIGFTLIFNGYLTWRPVVQYGEAYQAGIRIFTIPIEDFGYGLALLISTTSIYEKLKSVTAKKN